MAKRYYNDYKINREEREESKIISTPVTRVEKENNIVINGPVTINNEVNETNKVEVTNIQERTVMVYCNVRKSPMGEIAKTYHAGTAVKVVEDKDGWSKLDDGLFIRSDLLR